MTVIVALGDSQRDPNSRAEEHDRVLDFIERFVRDTCPSVVAHGGDWTERRSTHEDRVCIFGWAARVADVCPLVTVQGNHEEIDFVNELHCLDGEHTIVAATKPGTDLVGGVAWGLLPWPSRAAVHAWIEQQGGASSVEGVTIAANELLRHVLMGLGAKLASYPEEFPRVLLCHAEPTEYQTDPDQPMQMAQGIRVSVDDLVNLTGADCVLVSHIHKGQHFDVLRADGVTVPVILIGSPRRTAYAKGELAEKGIVRVVFDGRRLVSWERIPTPATPLHLVEVEWRSFGDFWGFVGDDARGFMPKGAEIRLRYTVTPDRREAARAEAEKIEAEWRAMGALDVKLDEVLEPVTRAKAPEVAQATTLADALRATWTAQGASAPDAARQERLVRMAESAVEGVR